MELDLSVRFKTGDGNKIHLRALSVILPVNYFFVYYLETINISRKNDLKIIVCLRHCSSIAVYMCSMMENMSADQMRIIERDVLLGKKAVTGLDVRDKLNTDDPFTPYLDLVSRRKKFTPLLDGEKNYIPDREIKRNNLTRKDNKYFIPMILLAPFFSINSEPSMGEKRLKEDLDL